jgi:UDP-N-acetylmuramoyl-L-alanyl-D-glutamate--2,6-diaminopimelate ligase
VHLQEVAEITAGTVVPTGADVDVAALAYDSRAVTPGALFLCVPGEHTDGHDHAPAAVAAGAVALLVERPLDLGVPEVQVPDARAAMGVVAAAFHGHPSDHLDVVGVTGTNGKTTVVHLLQAVLRHAGRRPAVIGTLTGARTTPEAPDLQALLAGYLGSGRDSVAMEVSSHALALDRVVGTRFRVAVFTNLTPEHLDFHASMDDYFAAKARLFTPAFSDRAVVDVDDPRGRELLARAEVPTTGFSVEDLEDLAVGLTGSRFRWRGEAVDLQLGGRFNVANALAAAEAAVALDLDPATVAAGLGDAPPVPGRFEPVDAGQPFGVVVDYAHTPDGLERLLETSRELVGDGRVIVVFGCGGDRDRAKRPLMGAVAARLADRVLLTSDNPRSEDPAAIIEEVRAGIDDPETLVIDPDRRSAIRRALDAAGPGDLVVVAGKGHEPVQIVGDRTLPFDDRAVARELLEEIGS